MERALYWEWVAAWGDMDVSGTEVQRAHAAMLVERTANEVREEAAWLDRAAATARGE